MITSRGISGTRRAVTGLGALVAAGLLATACGSSASSGTSTTAAPGTTAAGSTGTTPTTTGASGSTTTTSGSSLGASFLGKFQSGAHATFTATYKITSGSSASKLSSLTIAQQSPNSLFKGVSGGSTFEFLSIGTKSYLCSQTAGKWICLNGGKSNPEASLLTVYQPGAYLPYVQAAAKAHGATATYSTKSVNGFSLSCVSVTGAKGEQGTGTFCVTAQGVLGYVAWSGNTPANSGSFEITDYSTSVPGSDFTLPAKPTSIPIG